MPTPGDTQPRTAAEVEAELMSIAPAEEPDEEEELEQEEPPEPTPVELEAAAVTRSAELEAGRKGWVPRDQYKGDAAKWVDAKTFLERGERFTANLQREIADLKGKVASFEGTKAAFTKFHEELMAKKNTEIKAAISALRVQRSEAIGDGEHEVAVEIEDRIELLRGQQKELEEAPPPEQKAAEESPKADAPIVDPVILEWIDDGNKWFDEDPKMRSYAIAIGDEMIKNGETVRGRKFLDKVAATMREEFPRKFREKEAIPPLHHVEADDNTPRGKAGKTEKDLPPEDLALMRQFIKEGWTTKDKFLKSYFA